MTLPDWVQWAQAIATLVGAGLFAGIASWLAARTLALTRWQKSVRELANLKGDLEQRVGHAYVAGQLDDPSTLISLFPQDVPHELRADRRRRLKSARACGDLPAHLSAAFCEFQTFVFSRQPDDRWTLAVVWDTCDSALNALNRALMRYQLPEAETSEDDPLVPLWVSGQTYLVYTRLAPQSGRRQR